MKHLFSIAIPAALCFTGQAFAQIVSFDFQGGNGVASQMDANVTPGSFINGVGTLSFPNSSGAIRAQVSSTSWATTGDIPTALASSSYVEFTVTPNMGFQFTPTGLSFQISSPAPGFGGIASDALFLVAVNQNTTGVSISDSGSIDEGSTPISRSASFTGIQNLTSATSFRVYVYNAAADANGAVRFDNFVLTGTVSAVPEPAHVAMASALGLVGFGLYRRSRKA